MKKKILVIAFVLFIKSLNSQNRLIIGSSIMNKTSNDSLRNKYFAFTFSPNSITQKKQVENTYISYGFVQNLIIQVNNLNVINGPRLSEDVVDYKKSIRVYPVPASEYIYIYSEYFKENQSINLKIFDVTGKLVFQKKLFLNGKTIILPIEFLIKGVYFVKVSNERLVETIKIIKD